MIPQQVLSSQVISAPFLPPRNISKASLLDFEQGGIAISDPSQGLQVQTWRGEVSGSNVILSAPSVAPTVVFTQANIIDFAFTFDQNMKPFLAYVLADKTAWFRWFDTTVSNFVVTGLPANTITPRCSLDDKRQDAGIISGASDIILTYIRGGNLYFRAQRDRYGVEYLLKTGLTGFGIGQFGMNNVWRMQWQLTITG